MSFGLTNALVAFMDLLNRVFRDYVNLYVIVFIDDILIYSKNDDEHNNHLRLALEVLKEHKFAKFSNCESWLRSVSFLCHIIFGDGVKINHNKTDPLRNCPRPLNPKDIRSFLGLSGYYRTLLMDFCPLLLL